MASAARVFVVTGANKGIGYTTVSGICAAAGSDAIVYLTARSVECGTAALEQLSEQGCKTARFHPLDVDDASSIESFAAYIKKEHGGLDVLVNNAAIAYKKASTESFKEQADVTVRVNYFGLQAVCNALFPLLRSHARVVNVSSCVGFLPNVPGEALRNQLSSATLTQDQLDDVMKAFVSSAASGTHGDLGWQSSAYGASKVGVSALSRIQQREQDARSDVTDIIVNHCHPGFVDTDMTSHKGPLTPEQGAVAAVYLSLLPPNATSPRGDYIWHDKTIVDWVNGPTPSAY